jgi:putative endonuclease
MNKGAHYELEAARFLAAAGLNIVECNFRCKLGEIDLVCREGRTLVFVEVRYRGNSRFASAAASVTPHKQRRLLRTAQYYLQIRSLHDREPCRFDILAFDSTEPDRKDAIQWLKNAFTL